MIIEVHTLPFQVNMRIFCLSTKLSGMYLSKLKMYREATHLWKKKREEKPISLFLNRNEILKKIKNRIIVFKLISYMYNLQFLRGGIQNLNHRRFLMEAY